MKGNKKVIAELNAALRDELLAINQYFLHAEMLENWKYSRLSRYIKKQSIDEMRHAEGLIERILFLDGTPNLTEPMKLDVGLHVKEQLERQLQLEIDAVAAYNKSIAVCQAEGDNASRNLFEKMLHDEEGHVDWLEAQLHQIQEMGYERYLSEQVKEAQAS
jgi:bacterioferritin